MQASQIQLGSSVFPSPTSSGYSLYAQPDKYGSMDMDQLHEYFDTIVNPYFNTRTTNLFILDFSLVTFWDISAVLWLVVALHFYKREGFRFQLRLPEIKEAMLDDQKEAIGKSADFLRRWRFDEGLKNISLNLSDILVPDQRDYFNQPISYYPETEVKVSDRVIEPLLSKQLAAIKNLADFDAGGSRKVSSKIIGKCIKEFQVARIGDILQKQCNMEKRKADLFSDVLLTEGIVNVKEHPNASIGMLAISVLGKSKELILAIADNGESIPKTIYNTYLSSEERKVEQGSNCPEEYDRDQMTLKLKSIVTDYATWPGVTRKLKPEENITLEDDVKVSEMGMGLYYIKKETLDALKGDLKIATSGISVSYKSGQKSYVTSKCRFLWKGNLLRISIPIQEQ